MLRGSRVGVVCLSDRRLRVRELLVWSDQQRRPSSIPSREGKRIFGNFNSQNVLQGESACFSIDRRPADQVPVAELYNNLVRSHFGLLPWIGILVGHVLSPRFVLTTLHRGGILLRSFWWRFWGCCCGRCCGRCRDGFGTRLMKCQTHLTLQLNRFKEKLQNLHVGIGRRAFWFTLARVEQMTDLIARADVGRAQKLRGCLFDQVSYFGKLMKMRETCRQQQCGQFALRQFNRRGCLRNWRDVISGVLFVELDRNTGLSKHEQVTIDGAATYVEFSSQVTSVVTRARLNVRKQAQGSLQATVIHVRNWGKRVGVVVKTLSFVALASLVANSGQRLLARHRVGNKSVHLMKPQRKQTPSHFPNRDLVRFAGQ